MADDAIEKIRAALDEANECEDQAREHRRRAGRLLRGLGGYKQATFLAQRLGVDARLVELLLDMAP
jgi:hypothetical protein